MRLAIATTFLETYGGVEKTVLKIAKHFDSSIYTTSYSPDFTFPEFKNLDIHSLKSSLQKLPLEKRFISGISAGKSFYDLKLDDFDLINPHQSPSEWVRNKNSPVLWYCHTPNREAFDLYEWRMKRRNPLQKAMFWAAIQAFRRIEFKLVPKIEYIFTNSKNSQARIKKYLNRDAEILYPGIEPKEFSCKDYEKFFFYPSRVVPEKEIEYAIRAFEIFSSKNKGWKIVIAGALSRRPEHAAYLRKIRAMAGQDVEILTNIGEEKLKDLYSRCFSVLYTPVNEDFGLVPIEAMASSKPCIARNEGGPRETIENGKDGFLVNSEEEMAQMMERLAKRPELAEEMGKTGRKKVIKKFTWERFLKRFEQKARELSKSE